MGERTAAPITTILFTDLGDSTTLMQRVGDERYWWSRSYLHPGSLGQVSSASGTKYPRPR